MEQAPFGWLYKALLREPELSAGVQSPRRLPRTQPKLSQQSLNQPCRKSQGQVQGPSPAGLPPALGPARTASPCWETQGRVQGLSRPAAPRTQPQLLQQSLMQPCCKSHGQVQGLSPAGLPRPWPGSHSKPPAGRPRAECEGSAAPATPRTQPQLPYQGLMKPCLRARALTRTFG